MRSPKTVADSLAAHKGSIEGFVQQLDRGKMLLVEVTPRRSQAMTGCTLSLWRSGGHTPEVIPAVTHIPAYGHRVAMSSSRKRLSRQPDGRFPAVPAGIDFQTQVIGRVVITAEIRTCAKTAT